MAIALIGAAEGATAATAHQGDIRIAAIGVEVAGAPARFGIAAAVQRAVGVARAPSEACSLRRVRQKRRAVRCLRADALEDAGDALDRADRHGFAAYGVRGAVRVAATIEVALARVERAALLLGGIFADAARRNADMPLAHHAREAITVAIAGGVCDLVFSCVPLLLGGAQSDAASLPVVISLACHSLEAVIEALARNVGDLIGSAIDDFLHHRLRSTQSLAIVVY